MEINSSMTIECTCLCTCDAVQYRDGIIIQISTPRDDIEFRVKTVSIYNILVENPTFNCFLKRSSCDSGFLLPAAA